MAHRNKKRNSGNPAGHSNGSRPGSKHFYRPVWSGGKWDEFVMSRSRGKLLQVCCGASRLGLARIDLEAPAMNVQADMVRLPFADDSFDTAACDPPYGIPMPLRVHLQRELFRVTKQRVLFKATWIPRGGGWKLAEAVMVGTHTCQNIGIMSAMDRLPETADLFVEE